MYEPNVRTFIIKNGAILCTSQTSHEIAPFIIVNVLTFGSYIELLRF